MATRRSNKLVGQTGNKKWDSLHCAVTEAELAPHRDKWEVVERSLSPSDSNAIGRLQSLNVVTSIELATREASEPLLLLHHIRHGIAHDNFIIFCGSLHMEENGLYFGAESL